MFFQWTAEIWLRIRALFLRRQLDRDLSEELQFHLAMREEKLQEQGMRSGAEKGRMPRRRRAALG
jgi:hypothetical protein